MFIAFLLFLLVFLFCSLAASSHGEVNSNLKEPATTAADAAATKPLQRQTLSDKFKTTVTDAAVSQHYALSRRVNNTATLEGERGAQSSLSSPPMQHHFSTQAINGQVNTILYKGSYYSTLSDVGANTDSTYCQDYYRDLKIGWVVAPDDEDARDVIAEHSWSTQGVTLSSGNVYRTKYYTGGSPDTKPGDHWRSNYLCGSGNSYSVCVCRYYSYQILVKYTPAPPVAQGGRTNAVIFKGIYYSTLGDVAVDTDNHDLCQDYYIQMPRNWILAPDSADTREIIAQYYWSTLGVVLSSGNVYRTRYYDHNDGDEEHAGQLWRSDYLCQSTSGNSYRVCTCTQKYYQILIQYVPPPTATPTRGPTGKPTP